MRNLELALSIIETRNFMGVIMTHQMNLNLDPFNRIQMGTKTIELRLYDEKRKSLKNW